jgi:hypothetical protein
LAITNSVKNILQGLGVPGLASSASSSTTVSASAVTVTCTLPAGSLANYGYVRVKVPSVTTGSLVSAVFTATDGTTTVYLPDPIAITSGTAGQGMEAMKPFVSDLNLRTFVCVLTGAASFAGVTVDFEVFGN